MEVKIRCYDMEGNMLQDFKSVKEAATILKISDSMISQCLQGDSNFCLSFQFRKLRKNTPENIGVIIKSLAGKDKVPVVKYWNGKIISVYITLSEAALKNNISQADISMCIKNNAKKHGFIFLPLK